MDLLPALQAAALVEEFTRLAQEIAASTAAPTPEAAGPCLLILRSGVATCNDNTVGQFSDRRTAELCGQFLMALDRVYQPEYARMELAAIEPAGSMRAD